MECWWLVIRAKESTTGFSHFGTLRGGASPKEGTKKLVLSCGEHSNQHCGFCPWLLEKPTGGIWSWGGACRGKGGKEGLGMGGGGNGYASAFPRNNKQQWPCLALEENAQGEEVLYMGLGNFEVPTEGEG